MPDFNDQLDSLDPSGRSRRRKRRHHDSPTPPAPIPVPAKYIAPPAPELPAESASDESSAAAATSESSQSNEVTPAEKLLFPKLVPLNADEQAPPLPASIAVVTNQNLFDERLGKRKRKKAHGDGGPKKCPFCKKRTAVHIQPRQGFSRMLFLVGIRTFSCRTCHIQHMGFGSMEGIHFTWRQVGVTLAILGVMVVVLLLLYPIFAHNPEPAE